MAFLRSRKHDDPAGGTAAPVNPGVVDGLSAAAAKGATGAFEVVDRVHGGTARAYLFEGGLYAVELDGYRPPVLSRVRSSGGLDSRGLARLDELAGADQSHAGGITGVAEGWIAVEALGRVHQEYVLAGLGAIVTLSKARTKFHAGVITDQFCTVPLRVDPLFATVRLRAERLLRTWAVLEDPTDPDLAVLAMTGQAAPPSLGSPEFTAFIEGSDGRRELDAVAYAAGFTRAEAVHVAVVLVQAGVLEIRGRVERGSAPGALLVPEAFGSRAPGGPPPGGTHEARPDAAVPSAAAPATVPADSATVESRTRRAQLVAELTDALAQAEAIRDEATSQVDDLRARLAAAEADLDR